MKAICIKIKNSLDTKSATALVLVSLMLISACGRSDTKNTAESASSLAEETQMQQGHEKELQTSQETQAEQDDNKETFNTEPEYEASPVSGSGTDSTNNDPSQYAFYFYDPQSLTFTDTYEGSQGGKGSGCTPQSNELTDGIWFGLIQVKNTDSIIFDLACFYVDELAQEKASEEGYGELMTGFYISNQNPNVFDLEVDQQALVHEIRLHNENYPQPTEMINYAEWPSDSGKYLCWAGGETPCYVWVAINNGRVTEILEQYLP
ncbi:MAG: hypothetical protein CL457_05025 [Acidimicrobiaceae bacterium]|nr:hypothetical protein [Acidimicrobiaceae bacterium]|tara:strand:- start:5110 stop:5898 length:789 start_codon:yes stop_codon:yes gene_type:complete